MRFELTNFGSKVQRATDELRRIEDLGLEIYGCADYGQRFQNGGEFSNFFKKIFLCFSKLRKTHKSPQMETNATEKKTF